MTDPQRLADAIDPRKNAFQFIVGDPAVMEPARLLVLQADLIAASDALRGTIQFTEARDMVGGTREAAEAVGIRKSLAVVENMFGANSMAAQRVRALLTLVVPS